MARVDIRPVGGDELIRSGLDRIRDRFDVPIEFPADVDTAAREASARPLDPGRADLTHLPFMTLDPETSVDLDQAFALDRDGDAVILHYAIADVAHFVQPGDVIESEAWRRGVTVYLPDRRARLYPPSISESAASLLPDGPRPAVVFTVRVAPDGVATIDDVRRAIVRSRLKLAYETVTRDELPAELGDLATRIATAEAERGAARVETPEQAVVRDPRGRYRIEFRPRSWSQDWSSAMSLATNLAVASMLLQARTGLYRVLPAPDERAVRRLRHSARALGIVWPADEPLTSVERRLDPVDPRHAAFRVAIRRAAGGASYAPFGDGDPPWHSAVAAPYAHVTAPLRRLADRYVLDAAVVISAGRQVPDHVADAFTRLPEVMERAENRASQVERAVVDLLEAVVLRDRVGSTFPAVVTDVDDRGARIQLAEPAVIARVGTTRVEPGDEIRVKLAAADPERGSVVFDRVA